MERALLLTSLNASASVLRYMPFVFNSLRSSFTSSFNFSWSLRRSDSSFSRVLSVAARCVSHVYNASVTIRHADVERYTWPLVIASFQ